MRLGRLTFDEEGNRILPEATLKERKNMRKYNWFVCETRPTTVEADLAAGWGETHNREVQRTVPLIHFADNTEIYKLPFGLRHIVAHEAVNLDQAIQACEITYGEWYQDRLATVTLEMADRTLSVSIPPFSRVSSWVGNLTSPLTSST